MSEWISVKDELPKRRCKVFVAYVFDDYPVMVFYGAAMFHPEKDADNGYVHGPHFDNEGMDGMRVIYWSPILPLPELPKED